MLNWVSSEHKVLDFGKHGKFVKLIPNLDSVVTKEEILQLLAILESINLVDLVIRQPEFFESLADFIECHNSLDVVARQRQNFDVLKLWKCGHTVNSIGRQRQFSATLKLVKLFSHLVHRRKLAIQSDISGFTDRSVRVKSFPFLDRFTSRSSFRHNQIIIITSIGLIIK